MPTNEELLSQAGEAIAKADQMLVTTNESANQLYRQAADGMATAQEQKASQRQIAETVKKSLGWVCTLLNWRKGGYRGSPFGAQSKKKRARKAGRSGTEHHQKGASAAQQKNAEAESLKANDETAKAKAEAQAAKAEAEKSKRDAKKAREEAAQAQADAQAWKERAKANSFGLGGRHAATPLVAHRDRDLLVKTLGMLGSNQEGECLNAARKAEELRKRLGLMWGDLIIPSQVTHASAA